MGVMPLSSGGLDHVLHGFQVESAVLHVDEDVIEAGGGEGAADFRRPVDLQAAPEDRFALGQPFPCKIRAHGLTIAYCARRSPVCGPAIVAACAAR